MPVKITEPFQPLLDPSSPEFGKRYNVFYGGRGGGKTTGVADALLVSSIQEPQLILCAREFQNSITESVHRTLADQIVANGMQDVFEVQNTTILARNGSEFIFKGIKHNVQSIKSIPNIKKAWLEEAQSLSQKSIDVLDPTIRMPGSQLIISMNPELEDDPAYQYFVANPQPDSYLCKINYTDNPFITPELLKLADTMQRNNPDKFRNVWLGQPSRMTDGAILAKWIDAMENPPAGEPIRITKVPYNPAAPVITAWDLGYSDATVIWFAQVIGKEPRIIDFYQGTGVGIDHYVNLVRSKPYNYEMHVLPHDAGHNSLRTGQTLVEQLKQMGLGNDNNITVLPVVAVETGNELSRQLLTQLWIDKEKCIDGIRGLKKYHYEWDDDRKVYKPKPVHDWASDIADSFRYLASYLAKERNSIANLTLPGYHTQKVWG